jgi:hypothetical protein
MTEFARKPSQAQLQAAPQSGVRVLYLGPAADELCTILAPQIGRVDIAYHSDVQPALEEARARVFDMVLVDQRDRSLATKLIMPLVAGLGYPVKLVVISPFSEISHYLAVPGVARVLAAPLREGQLLRVLGLERRVKRGRSETGTAAPASAGTRKAAVLWASDGFMALVSTLYKRAAFALLFALFLAFTFYGVLIGYFLMSSSWGAPMTLTRGHELVNKAERELTEMKVALNQTEQRLTGVALEKDTALRDLEEARGQVKTAIGTVEREIKLRRKQVVLLQKSAKRLAKVRADLAKQLGKGGIGDQSKTLYGKRLITKKTYTSNELGLLEAQQRLAAVDNDMEESRAKAEDLSASVTLLTSLRDALRNEGPVAGLTASAPDLLMLTKQAVEARTAQFVAKSRIATADTTREQLERNRKVLAEQIASVALSAAGRAIHTRVDVVFVPYANDQQFREDASLYSCLLTIFWCSKAGVVGHPLPGEFSTVHPFFGKPIRGFFVEASNMNPDAATREIIHGTRAPFFF